MSRVDRPACFVENVYAVVHTDAGDLRADRVDEVRINGKMVTFFLAARSSKNCTLKGSTLCLGAERVSLNLHNEKMYAGGTLTVVHPVEISDLEVSDKANPYDHKVKVLETEVKLLEPGT